MNPIKRRDPCKCVECGKETLVVYNMNKSYIIYKILYDNMKDKLDRVELSHIYCYNCKKNYIIDWTFGHPRQCITKIL